MVHDIDYIWMHCIHNDTEYSMLEWLILRYCCKQMSAPLKIAIGRNVRTRESHDSLPQNLQPNPLVPLPSLVTPLFPIPIIFGYLISPFAISVRTGLTRRRSMGLLPLRFSLVDLGLEMFEVGCSKRYSGRIRSYHVVGRNCSFWLSLQSEEMICLRL